MLEPDYALNSQVMKLAARSGTNYVELGGLYHETRRQLQLTESVDFSRILCVIGMGATPGTMNVLAELGATRLDEVHEIHLRCGGYDPHPSTALLPAPYSLETILDEFTLPAIAMTDGELVELPAASQEEATRPMGWEEPMRTRVSHRRSWPR